MAPPEQAKRQDWLDYFIDIAPDATVIVDENGCIRRVNALAEDLFGYSSQEMVGQVVEMLVPDEFRSGHPKMLQSFFDNASIRQMMTSLDLKAQRKSGERIPVSIGLSPLQDFGQGHQVPASIRDNTELHRARDLAEEAAMAKSAFLERFRDLLNRRFAF
jgi:PAS domain S-box-containing protein